MLEPGDLHSELLHQVRVRLDVVGDVEASFLLLMDQIVDLLVVLGADLRDLHVLLAYVALVHVQALLQLFRVLLYRLIDQLRLFLKLNLKHRQLLLQHLLDTLHLARRRVLQLLQLRLVRLILLYRLVQNVRILLDRLV